MAEEVDGRNPEDALGRFDNKAVEFKTVEESFQMNLVLLLTLTGHQDVVHINEDKTEVVKDPVHHALERLGRVPETKWHTQEFPQPKRGNYCSLRNIVVVERNLMIPFHQVNLRKDGYTC